MHLGFISIQMSRTLALVLHQWKLVIEKAIVDAILYAARSASPKEDT